MGADEYFLMVETHTNPLCQLNLRKAVFLTFLFNVF